MYEARQHKDEKSRQIEKNKNRNRNNSSLSIIQSVAPRPYLSYENARKNWIKHNEIKTVKVDNKFQDDHMQSVSIAKAKEMLRKRQNANKNDKKITKSTLIYKDEKVSDLVLTSAKDEANVRAGVFENRQQLSVKFNPVYGSITAYVDDDKHIKTRYSNSVVVSGDWSPEKGEVHVHHYGGEDLQNEDKMNFEYMWHDNTKPILQDKEETIRKLIDMRRFKYNNKNKSFKSNDDTNTLYLEFLRCLSNDREFVEIWETMANKES